MLANFHVFVNFLFSSSLLISSFIPLWSVTEVGDPCPRPRLTPCSLSSTLMTEGSFIMRSPWCTPSSHFPRGALCPGHVTYIPGHLHALQAFTHISPPGRLNPCPTRWLSPSLSEPGSLLPSLTTCLPSISAPQKDYDPSSSWRSTLAHLLC